MSCYEFEGTRYIRNRHFTECGGDDCSGCLRCTEAHCGECRKGTHLGFGEHTCPECVGKVRAALRSLLDLYAALPAEAEHKGVNSEAASLSGPVTDPEAWSWRRATKARTEHVLLSTLDDEDDTHPVALLRRWVWMLGEDYGDQPSRALTLSEAVDWLDVRLGRIANDAGQDFGLFRREVGRCRAHMEAVLHDQGMGDPANIGCFECNAGLERRLTAKGFEDHWTCKGCRRKYTYAEYNFALRAALEETA